MVDVLGEGPGEGAELRGAFDATGRGLVDVDMSGAGVVGVLGDGEGDGGPGDGFAG